MKNLIKLIYSIKPWRVPTKLDGMTIDNAALAKLIGRN